MIYDTHTLIFLFSVFTLSVVIVFTVRHVSPKRDETLKDYPIFSNLFYLQGHPLIDSSVAIHIYLGQHDLLLQLNDNSQKVSIPRNAILDLQIIDKSTVVEDDPTILKGYIGYWGYLASKKKRFLLVIKWHDQKHTY